MSVDGRRPVPTPGRAVDGNGAHRPHGRYSTTLRRWMANHLVGRSKGTAAVFIVLNSLTAGSIFCFPLFGPKMAADLGLSLIQTNAIWSGAVLGQYATAAIFGHIADTHGPRPLSMLAAILFGVGYVLMAHTESSAVEQRKIDASASSSNSANFIAMVVYFVLVGAGVAASVFSAVRASTSHFKSHPGLALSIPLTLFSLSSLFLTAFASLPFFTDPETGDLNSPRWLAWLGAALMITNAMAAFGLSVSEEDNVATQNAIANHDSDAARSAEQHATERTALLGGRTSVPALHWSIPFGRDPRQYSRAPILSLTEYLSCPSFWIMAVVIFGAVGGAEMVMSSVGSMVVSLRAGQASALEGGSPDQDDNTRLGRETLALRTQQVQLLAIANTVARLLVGLFSDLYAPRGETKQDGQVTTTRRHRRFTVSRLTLLMGGMLLLMVTFIYSATFLNTVDHLWIVSLATGTGYGLTFTLLPSIINSVWPAQLGRNYGLLTYAAALGSLCFSLLFASVNDRVAEAHQELSYMVGLNATTPATVEPAQAICAYGRECFAPSFALAAVAAGLAAVIALPLWRKWRYYV